LDALHAFAQGVHHAGELAAGNGGERRRAERLHGPGADLPVDRVQPGGLDADADLAGAGLGDLDVGLLQDLGAAETVELDGFHDGSFANATQLGG
jgi:hypothetical protein